MFNKFPTTTILIVIIIVVLCFFSSNHLSNVNALRIAIFTVEESGHLMPMTSIVHEALKQGHSVDIFMSPHAIDSTKSVWPSSSSSSSSSSNKKNQIRFVPIIGTEHFRADHPDNFTLYQELTEAEPLITLARVDELAHNWFIEMLQPLRTAVSKVYHCSSSSSSSDSNNNDDENEQENLPDVILSDYAWNNLALATHASTCISKKPLVFLWPLTLSLPTQTLSSLIPALGTGFTLKDLSENPLYRFANHVLQRVMIMAQRHSSKLDELLKLANVSAANKTQQELGFDSVNEIITNHFVITPSVFGLDLGQPLCPNIRPVGFLTPPANDDKNREIPQEWNDWLNEFCYSNSNSKSNNNNNQKQKQKQTIYVNMGSIAIMPERWLKSMEAVLRYISEQEGICVIWKMRLTEQMRLEHPPESAKEEVAKINEKSQQEQQQVLYAGSGAVDEQHDKKDKTHSEKTLASHTKPIPGKKLAIVSRIPFPPKLLLSEGNIGAFVSHCGDTSVYESVQALTPIVGIPLFADQPDMCARIADAGVGMFVNKKKLEIDLNSLLSLESKINNNNENENGGQEKEQDLVSEQQQEEESTNNNAMMKKAILITESPLHLAIHSVLKNREKSVNRLNYLRKVGDALGGAKEAVRVLELASMHGGETVKHFSCRLTQQPWYIRDGWDISIFLGLLILVPMYLLKKALQVFFNLLMRGSLKKKEKKEKKD